jgi:hypothetical protein
MFAVVNISLQVQFIVEVYKNKLSLLQQQQKKGKKRGGTKSTSELL